MKETRLIMGMPVLVEIVDAHASQNSLDKVFEYFTHVDETFSTYKAASEISRINRGELSETDMSEDMRRVFALAEETKRETSGYFDIRTPSGMYDPSGVVKGWAIKNAALLLHSLGHTDFYVEVGGDIQTAGMNADGTAWRIGIRNPFNRDEIVKVVSLQGEGIATSGTAIRGEHIYDPHTGTSVATNLASLTVLGPNVYDADRFATAAFAMGEGGITFIEHKDGFEAYAINTQGIATMTSGFARYTMAGAKNETKKWSG